MRGLLAVLGLSLVTLAPGALAAATVSGELTLRGLLEMDAEMQAGGSDGALDLAGVRAEVASGLAWGSAIGNATEHQWLVAGENTVSLPDHGERPVTLGRGHVTAIDCFADCQVLLYADGAGTVDLVGDAHGPLPELADKRIYWAEIDTGAHGTFARVFPKGTVAWGPEASSAARVEAAGAFFLFARDAVLHVETTEGDTQIDVRDERSDASVVLGDRAQSVTSRFVVLELRDARMRASTRDLTALLPSLAGTLTGRVATDHAFGPVSMGGERRSLEGASLAISGALSLARRVGSAPGATLLDPPESAATLTFEGEADQVWIDGRLVQAPAREAAVVGSLLVVVLGLLLLAARLSVPLYSRISRDRVFANENRRRLWQILTEGPPQTATALSRRLGLSRIVVRHHMAILTSHRLVGSSSDGRGRLYFPSGRAPSADGPASLLKDASRLRIARVLAQGAATQASISDETGLSRRMVSYHLTRLERQGLVAGHGGWRRRYEPTARLIEALADPSQG